jgi:hypothetical protein
MNKLEFHPIADLLPLEVERIPAMAFAIRARGLERPIVTLDNKILDGRLRYEACCRERIAPVTKPFDGDNPVKHVMTENLPRHNLTYGQKALIAADIYLSKPYPNIKPMHEIGTWLGIAQSDVSEAKLCIEYATPEELAKIMDGEVSVHTTVRHIRKRIGPNNRELRPLPPMVATTDVKEWIERAREIARAFAKTNGVVSFADIREQAGEPPSKYATVAAQVFRSHEWERIPTRSGPAHYRLLNGAEPDTMLMELERMGRSGFKICKAAAIEIARLRMELQRKQHDTQESNTPSHG